MKSWNEIRKNATAFAKRWKTAFDEKSQAQSFLKEFFEVFGVDTVTQATFEHRVKFADGSQGFADCFWQGRILVEMKSRGKNLDAAYQQAMDYVRALPDSAILPQVIVVSDFQTFRFYNLAKDNALTSFKLNDLRKYVTLFGFMIGGESDEIREQDPVNRRAAEKMARLHDALKAIGYRGRELEVYLVRLLFCLFAEDTSIFKPDQFSNFIRTSTAEDGSDLAAKIAVLFQTLNTPPERRLASLDETVVAFPYVNGNLFGEMLPIPAFSCEMRRALLDCGSLDWSKISPAIFGAMFQGVMDEEMRHDLGAHYTSEENILKVIRPLFLDRLREEFDTICLTTGPSRKVKLAAFHDRIASLTFLDPACGCGNFLLIAYRELRRLEVDVLAEIYKDDPSGFLDISSLCKVDVSQFYGIEIGPFASEIAKVALWLMDHLCNLDIADRFGQYFARIPIKASPHIVCANALTTDWPRTDFIMGNPPFLGFTWMNAEQKADMFALFPDNKNLDLVCGWYKKANDLIRGTATRCAFVSTNSITQGENAAALWPNLAVEIDFAYRTFKWHNEAKGNAAVHCVIIGFHAAEESHAESAENAEAESHVGNAPRSLRSPREKIIYDGDEAIRVKNINCYLMDAPDIIVTSRNVALCDVPKMVNGNKPVDGGYLILTQVEKDQLVSTEPMAETFIKVLIGSREHINRIPRYCLWLVSVSPVILAKCPLVRERISKCRAARLASKDPGARKLAATPSLFRDTRNPKTAIVIPEVSSESRQYVPIGFIDDSVICTNKIQMIPDATLYDFGILISRMHMGWMRAVCGRLKSDYSYSKDIVYNNFVWPTIEQSEHSNIRTIISSAAQEILDVRKRYLDADSECTLAILYNPETMPPDLVKAHQKLDALVDKAYGRTFANDAERVAYLFNLYAQCVAAEKDTAICILSTE